jgi:hypothetical protein
MVRVITRHDLAVDMARSEPVSACRSIDAALRALRAQYEVQGA